MSQPAPGSPTAGYQAYQQSAYPEAPPQQQQHYVQQQQYAYQQPMPYGQPAQQGPPMQAAPTGHVYDPATKPGKQLTQQQPATYNSINNGTPVVATAGAPLLHGAQLGTPIYGDDCPSTLRSKFVSQGYKDVPFAVAFVLQLIAMIVVAIYNASNHKIDFHIHASRHEQTILIYLAVAFGIALLLSALALLLMRLFPKGFIWTANLFCIALDVGVGIFFLASPYSSTPYTSAVSFILAALHGLWLFFVRRRIPFAGVLLRYSVTTVTRHWGCILVSFVSLPILVAYVLGWAAMSVPTLSALQNRELSEDSASCHFTNSAEICGSNSSAGRDPSVGVLWGVSALFLLMFYWTTQVVTGVVHVTASGTVATWYFAGSQSMPHNPSVASLKRATTTSFGSICFGSLLVALLKLIYQMLRSQRNSRAGFLACVALCFLGCLERLLQYFNVYAFTHVAIYGMSYLEAASATWEMIKHCGWAAVFNDNLVEPALMMTSLVDSLAIGVGLGLVSESFVIGILCFVVSFVTHIILLRVVYSGIVTIFVCFAECSEVLAFSNPQFHRDIQLAHEELKRSAC